ncbi:hypothetical protein ACR9KC_00420 [Helicobacter pylori]
MQPKLKDNPTFTSKPLSFGEKWLQNTSQNLRNHSYNKLQQTQNHQS